MMTTYSFALLTIIQIISFDCKSKTWPFSLSVFFRLELSFRTSVFVTQNTFKFGYSVSIISIYLFLFLVQSSKYSDYPNESGFEALLFFFLKQNKFLIMSKTYPVFNFTRILSFCISHFCS